MPSVPKPSSSSSKSTPNERMLMISKRVAMMFSGYPQSDFTDPAGAALSMCSVFEDYSDELIKFATDPKTGVQRRHKWPPKIAEVVEFCDERVTYIASMERFRKWGQRAPMLEGPQEPRPTLDEMHAKYGENWGIDGGKTDKHSGFKTGQASSWEKITEQYHGDPAAMQRLTMPFMTRKGEAEK